MPNPRNAAHNFLWDASVKRYRDQRSGVFASQRTVTMLLNRQVTVAQKQMVSLGTQLQAGSLDVNQWRDAMREQLKSIHATQAAKAVGSFDQMDAKDWSRVGGHLKFQYNRLEVFATQISNGTQQLDGRFMQRVAMYSKSGYATFAATQTEMKQDKGFTQYRNILHPAEHCDQCLEETAKQWVAIGELVPIGQRLCKVNDRCTLEYR